MFFQVKSSLWTVLDTFHVFQWFVRSPSLRTFPLSTSSIRKGDVSVSINNPQVSPIRKEEQSDLFCVVSLRPVLFRFEMEFFIFSRYMFILENPNIQRNKHFTYKPIGILVRMVRQIEQIIELSYPVETSGWVSLMKYKYSGSVTVGRKTRDP